MDCNVIHVIRCYFNEVANIEVHLISLPLAYSVAIGPLPDTLGQMVNWWIWSLCILMPALSVMLSCFQLAYVTHFEAVFALNPIRLGQAAFLAALLLTLGPNVVEYWIVGSKGSLTVGILEKSEQKDTEFDFLAWHLVGWMIASAVLFLVSYLGIPLYLNLHGHLDADHYNYFPRMSAKRYSFVIFGLAILWNMIILANNPDHGGHLPFYNFIFLFTMNLLFVFQLTDRDVLLFVRRKLFNFLDTPVVHPDVIERSNDIPMSVLSTSTCDPYVSQVDSLVSNIHALSDSTASSRMSNPYGNLVPLAVHHLPWTADHHLPWAADRALREDVLYPVRESAHEFHRF